ncbi:hypothetical protein PBY51_007313 [Eleginops maclovinus]|uniref:UPAR/Ly6 domain-containing protein n=1 Tax=Eleginops maclovinus TaxID=56733 RepID=A0AAN7X9S9_ELEMC|nr:hypothetical protein PBY51_007313 [Eleginops maclovinus]
MKLLLTVCLTWALLYTAESLRCQQCTDLLCSNTNSVECPATSTACHTITSVSQIGATTVTLLSRNCSSLLTCLAAADIEAQWSVNTGYIRAAFTQICCITDNCNKQILTTPSSQTNGKQCPGCSADSIAGTCNATVSCRGVEDTCFNATITSNSTTVMQKGCSSRNLCTKADLLSALGENVEIKCGAPWSLGIGPLLLTLNLAAYKVLV